MPALKSIFPSLCQTLEYSGLSSGWFLWALSLLLFVWIIKSSLWHGYCFWGTNWKRKLSANGAISCSIFMSFFLIFFFLTILLYPKFWGIPQSTTRDCWRASLNNRGLVLLADTLEVAKTIYCKQAWKEVRITELHFIFFISLCFDFRLALLFVFILLCFVICFILFFISMTKPHPARMHWRLKMT